MSGAAVVSLEVRGFRAFGTAAAYFELGAPLTVAHAGNSQGKTSLAEALEFLLSGRSSRRELLGGAKAEYNDSLRNAHLPSGDDNVYVEAVVRTKSGSLHRVRRNLTCDFGRGAECESQLLLDGLEVEDLSSIGLVLADPPVRAPVLLQHILRHALSTEPKQRVAYFKSLLSLSDLDVLRERVGEARKRLERELAGPRLQSVETLPPDLAHAQKAIKAISENPPTEAHALIEVLSTALREAASAATGEAYASLTEARTGLGRRAKSRAEALFPISRFVVAALPDVNPSPPDIATYEGALARVEDETARLLPLFAAVLRTDAFSDLRTPADCPVCATPNALTQERIETLKTELALAANLDVTAANALASVEAAGDLLSTFAQWVRTGLPAASAMSASDIAELIARLEGWGIDPNLLQGAVATATALSNSAQPLVASGRQVRDSLTLVRTSIERREPSPDPGASYAELAHALAGVRESYRRHVEAAALLEEAVVPVIAARVEIEDHQQLSALIDEVSGLADDITQQSGRQRALVRVKAVEKALQDASGELLDARFGEMSDTIRSWWLTIRPDELVDFMGVQPRAGGTRFVNLVAALHAELGITPVVRDALGVYSDSQLNALGLSIFLARTELLGSPVVVLDDPIPGSDPDHRLTFVQNTLTRLLDAGVQVILTTYDGKLADWTMSNHDHRGLIGYELNLSDPRSGTVPTQTSDMFSRLMLDAEDNLNAPTARGRRAACGSYRSAAERLAKQIIATSRTEAGTLCSVADVDNEASTLGQLVPLVRGLALDNGEKGQWRTFASVLNPGNHDDDVPSTAELKVVRGNLRRIANTHREHWPNGLVS